MPKPRRTPRARSRRPGLKAAGILVVLIAATIVGTAAFTLAATPSKAISKTTFTPWPVGTRINASGGISKSINVVGIGDSVTSGSACSCETFVGLYATQLASQRGVETSSVNLGVPGWTSAQLLAAMTKPGTFRDQVAKADILLVTIGANDLLPLESRQPGGCLVACYGPLVNSVGHNVGLIVAAAQAAHPSHPPTILVTDYWNVFEDGDVGTSENGAAFQHWSDVLTRAASSAVCTAARQASATCVSIYAPFKGNGSKNPTTMLAGDGDHPDAAGHQVIATTLLANTPQPIP